MDLVNRVIAENRDKKKVWIIQKANSALPALFLGMNEIETNELEKYLLGLSQNQIVDTQNLSSFQLIAPLVFQSKHIFDTDKVKDLIISHDKMALDNKFVLETDLYFYSIIFDLYNGKNLDIALVSATLLSEEINSTKIDFSSVIDSNDNNISNKELIKLISILRNVKTNNISEDNISTFINRLIELKPNNSNFASINKYINYCIKL